MGSCFTGTGPAKGVDTECLARHDIGFYTTASYHPADRFWPFQFIEAGIYLGLALALLAFSVWWIRKRIS